MVQFDVKRVQKGTESFMVSFDYAKTPITQIADYIIIAANKHGTSDIHFDPRDDGMMVRFRIDGDCQDYTFVPKAYEKNLTTRLKLLANMNITESRLPQDGAIKGEFGGQYMDMRVSALPLNQGEKIVIRILDYTRSLQGIDSLGFHPKNLEKIKRMMDLPCGIILTTGATGSGKSTTTYSILQGLNKPEMNVITVEDPIEMNIEGINQVQVNADIGMTFAAALRSILRQDPNVILIGEIRDSETAQIAVRASITGHLVLSTIHTNNALATVERLLDMNVERYLLSTALSGIISQRLAKQLCPDCRYQRETTKYEKKVFKKYMHQDVAMVWDANPKGCENCRKGYHGRIAFHEVLELDDNIKDMISREDMDKKDLAKLVYSTGTISMLQDALIKCLDGKTSFEEVYKNIEIENEDDCNYEEEMATEIKESVPQEVVETEDPDSLIEEKNDGKNEINNIIQPPAFTAADFADSPTTDENAEGNSDGTKNEQAKANATAAPTTTPVTTPTPNVAQAQVTSQNTAVQQAQPTATPAPNVQPQQAQDKSGVPNQMIVSIQQAATADTQKTTQNVATKPVQPSQPVQQARPSAQAIPHRQTPQPQATSVVQSSPVVSAIAEVAEVPTSFNVEPIKQIESFDDSPRPSLPGTVQPVQSMENIKPIPLVQPSTVIEEGKQAPLLPNIKFESANNTAGPATVYSQPITNIKPVMTTVKDDNQSNII